MALHRSKRGEVAGIGQIVENEHLVIALSDEMPDQRGSDEARSTRDHDPHKWILCDYTRSETVNGASGGPSYRNGLANSLSIGSRRSLSEAIMSASLNGHGIAMSGSFQQMPLSCAGA